MEHTTHKKTKQHDTNQQAQATRDTRAPCTGPISTLTPFRSASVLIAAAIRRIWSAIRRSVRCRLARPSRCASSSEDELNGQSSAHLCFLGGW